MDGYRRVLAHRQFARLWMGQVVASFGESLRYIALLGLVYDLRGSTADVGAALMVSGSATVLAAPLAGFVADRYSRRNTVFACAVLRGALVALLTLTRTLTAIYVVLFLLALAQQFSNPALNALIPSILRREHLTPANALLALTLKGTSIVGPALGGLLVESLGRAPLFYAGAITSLVLAAAVWGVRPAQEGGPASAERSRSVISQYRQSVAYIAQTPLLVFAVAQAIVASLAGGAIDTLTIAFADRVLGSGAAGFGVILSAKSAGFVVGVSALEPLRKRVPRRVLLPAALVFTGLNIVAFGLNSVHSVAVLLAVLDGAGNSVASILSRVVFQDSVPDDLRGKVFATNYMLFSAAHMVSTGVSGALAEYLGLRIVFIAAGALLSGFGAWGGYWLRRGAADEPVPAS